MKKSPYLGRGLVALLLLLPLAAQALTIVSIIGGAITNSEVVMIVCFVLATAAVLWICFLEGCAVVLKRHASHGFSASDDSTTPQRRAPCVAPSPHFFVRYQPLVVAFGYTALFTLIGIFFPASKDGALFGKFMEIFGLTHLPGVAFIAMFSGLFGPTVWQPLAVILTVYIGYGAGNFVAFRQLDAAPTLARGRIIAGVIVVLIVTVCTWRYHHMTRDYLSGLSYRETEDQELTSVYNPDYGSDKLVKIAAPTLTIPDNFPRLDGATAAYPLYTAAAKAIYQKPTGSRFSEWVESSTTPVAYEKLLNGETDVIFVAQPSAAQRAAAEAAGRPLKLTPIGKEAFVFFVHADNPVTRLTTEQIRSIYTKRVTNWSEVGGAREKILPFQRPEGSGSQTALQLKVMRGERLSPPLREEFTEGMGGIVQRTAQYRNSRNAIGYSFRFFVTAMNNVKDVKLLKIDSVEPTRENIRSGAYPYTVDVYAVTAGTTNPNAQALINWFLSPQGQQLIEDTGYVSLKPAK